jgi:hypothetical protein
VHRPDDVVVSVPPEVLAEIGLEPAVVRQLDAEADGETARTPPFGGLTDDPLALLERRRGIGRRARLEVDVVGDGDLVDAAFQRLLSVRVDRHVAVRRQVRMQVRIERKVACLAINHRPRPRTSRTPPGAQFTPR